MHFFQGAVPLSIQATKVKLNLYLIRHNLLGEVSHAEDLRYDSRFIFI